MSVVTGEVECPYCNKPIIVDTKINTRVFYHRCPRQECQALMVVDLRRVSGEFYPKAIEGEREKAEERQRQLLLLEESDELVDPEDGTWDESGTEEEEEAEEATPVLEFA